MEHNMHLESSRRNIKRKVLCKGLFSATPRLGLEDSVQCRTNAARYDKSQPYRMQTTALRGEDAVAPRGCNTSKARHLVFSQRASPREISAWPFICWIVVLLVSA